MVRDGSDDMMDLMEIISETLERESLRISWYFFVNCRDNFMFRSCPELYTDQMLSYIPSFDELFEICDGFLFETGRGDKRCCALHIKVVLGALVLNNGKKAPVAFTNRTMEICMGWQSSIMERNPITLVQNDGNKGSSVFYYGSRKRPRELSYCSPEYHISL